MSVFKEQRTLNLKWPSPRDLNSELTWLVISDPYMKYDPKASVGNQTTKLMGCSV